MKISLMTQFKIIGRYKILQRGSYYVELVSDYCNRYFFEDLVSAKYPVVDLTVNT